MPSADCLAALAGCAPTEAADRPAARQQVVRVATWNTSLNRDRSGELVRDYLMRALYGTFSNVKRLEPELYANLEFEWMAYVAAQGEFRRYRGDHVLTELDIRNEFNSHNKIWQ